MSQNEQDESMIEYEKEYHKYVDLGYILGFTLDNGYFHSGDFKQCPYCNSKDHIDFKNPSYIDHILCEYEVICTNCNRALNTFAYGSYFYYFPKVNPSKEYEFENELDTFLRNK